MPVDWSSVETWEHLVASIYATGVKIDLREAAKYFGTTYDTLQSRFRKIKAAAEKLDKSDRSATASPSSAKQKPAGPCTPKVAKSKAANGRITKKSQKPEGTKKLKPEQAVKVEAGLNNHLTGALDTEAAINNYGEAENPFS